MLIPECHMNAGRRNAMREVEDEGSRAGPQGAGGDCEVFQQATRHCSEAFTAQAFNRPYPERAGK